MQFDLVAADEQAQIRDTDGLDRGGPEQGAVEQRRDAGQHVARYVLGAQFADQPPPHQSSAQRERQSFADRRGCTPWARPRPGCTARRRPAGWTARCCRRGGRRRRPARSSRHPEPGRAACPVRNRLRRRGFGGNRDRWPAPAGRGPDRVRPRRRRCRRRSGGQVLRSWSTTAARDLVSSSRRRCVTITATTDLRLHGPFPPTPRARDAQRPVPRRRRRLLRCRRSS